ncbi:LysR family transcriptional regulator [uncultured Moraxella sp.]|uniref:LysR family transcriptional regulator n=1 Tax=uncultured Moraxella sp. TaxID=263769 RepID=UPI0025FBF178|nr:LysR family transcriptional regulator [uncultured Moraxella sp.]
MSHISLDDIRLFVSVVQAGSLSAASDLTGVPVSRLSRRLTQLESALGTQLINRGKKGVSLNELGDQFFIHAQNMLEEADAAIQSIQNGLEKPSGLLRISAPVDIAHRYVIPYLNDYLTEYPDVMIDINLSQQKVNMIQDGIDIAIRVGSIDNDNVVAKRWLKMRFGIFATRSYIEKFGAPKTPNDLYDHRVIAQTLSLPWQFYQGDQEIKINPHPFIGCNDFTAVDPLIFQGLGIGKMTIESAQRHPELVHVLEDWEMESKTVSMLYYKNRGAIPAVRSFIDWYSGLFD